MILKRSDEKFVRGREDDTRKFQLELRVFSLRSFDYHIVELPTHNARARYLVWGWKTLDARKRERKGERLNPWAQLHDGEFAKLKVKRSRKFSEIKCFQSSCWGVAGREGDFISGRLGSAAFWNIHSPLDLNERFRSMRQIEEAN